MPALHLVLLTHTGNRGLKAPGSTKGGQVIGRTPNSDEWLSPHVAAKKLVEHHQGNMPRSRGTQCWKLCRQEAIGLRGCATARFGLTWLPVPLGNANSSGCLMGANGIGLGERRLCRAKGQYAAPILPLELSAVGQFSLYLPGISNGGFCSSPRLGGCM